VSKISIIIDSKSGVKIREPTALYAVYHNFCDIITQMLPTCTNLITKCEIFSFPGQSAVGIGHELKRRLNVHETLSCRPETYSISANYTSAR